MSGEAGDGFAKAGAADGRARRIRPRLRKTGGRNNRPERDKCDESTAFQIPTIISPMFVCPARKPDEAHGNEE